jgi:hypothetical protein
VRIPGLINAMKVTKYLKTGATPLVGNLNDNGTQIKVAWATTDEIKAQNIKIYPESIWKILEQLTKGEGGTKEGRTGTAIGRRIPDASAQKKLP